MLRYLLALLLVLVLRTGHAQDSSSYGPDRSDTDSSPVYLSDADHLRVAAEHLESAGRVEEGSAGSAIAS